VYAAIESGTRTPDLGGANSTQEMMAAVLLHIR
jgi:isocitrate/isopropylmalate dehydrogenase